MLFLPGLFLLIFQSTPPARGATTKTKGNLQPPPISIHAPREGGDLNNSVKVSIHISISIHAPREGGDQHQEHLQQIAGCISIHAPREGGDSKDAQFYL